MNTPSSVTPPLAARILRGANYLYSHLFHRLTVQSPSQLPAAGPAILVCNHISALDPLLLQAPNRRLITWMMAAEYYEIPSLKWIFRSISAIPVQRTGRDSASLRAGLRALEAGQILGLFPEGKINETPSSNLLPFQPGIALLALKAQVPIYPAYLEGSHRRKEMLPVFLRPQRVHLRFGPPIELSRFYNARDSLPLASAEIRAALEKLQTEALLALPQPLP